ncbi:MAG: DUF2950 family protein [Aridibacter sp.]
MRFQNLIFILIISIILTGCFGNETETSNISNENTSAVNNTNTSENNVSENINKESAEKAPLDTETAPPPQKVNEAETLTPIVNAFCNAVNSKNEAALQKVYSREAWKTMQNYAKAEGSSSVAAFLNDSEPVGKKCSVINEQISNNRAVARVTTETYPKGIELKFVKEGNDWKMTTQSTEF